MCSFLSSFLSSSLSSFLVWQACVIIVMVIPGAESLIISQDLRKKERKKGTVSTRVSVKCRSPSSFHSRSSLCLSSLSLIVNLINKFILTMRLTHFTLRAPIVPGITTRTGYLDGKRGRRRRGKRRSRGEVRRGEKRGGI